MVAGPERQPAALLREMRALDRRVGPFEQRRRLGVARLRLLAFAPVPQQAAGLAQDARRADAVAGRAV